MRIFLTGATGYLGGALARRWASEGHEVRALIRPGRDPQPLEREGVQTFVGDIAERASLREGMSGAEWVVHAAAYVDLDGPREAMELANVQGSDNVASLAYKLGVGRLLSVSSVAIFGGSPRDGSLAREGATPELPFPSWYSSTKAAGHERIGAWARQGLKVNTVFPSLIYGPPGKRQGANVLLRAVMRGRFPALVGGDRKTSWVHIDDVVEAMSLILAKAPPGRDFVLAGDVVTVGEVFREVARLSGTRPPRLRLSAGAARAVLGPLAPLARLLGRPLPVSPGQLRSLARHWAFDDTRAREELGWRPRSLAEGLPGTLEFLRGGP